MFLTICPILRTLNNLENYSEGNNMQQTTQDFILANKVQEHFCSQENHPNLSLYDK